MFENSASTLYTEAFGIALDDMISILIHYFACTLFDFNLLVLLIKQY